ncbi:Asp-tRNA(Asn)/Glu-tRNA(Gln) amidotransferase subunit GatB [Candidatus Peregrinibacteria bacterium]|nr:Asp-tRNA(Asn)/Glu-tRNA(Gln) amidotransferase subunit GatB [Candidatus Peregrinibacteria bacterium]
MHSAYESVMGLEIHARIKTKTKMFCGCSNDTWKAEPNEHICDVCAGFPGSLPVLNKEALHKGVLTALAMGCTIPKSSKFDRKSYFYPDLPSGYQISQYDEPIAVNGTVTIFVEGEKKKFRFHRIHLENDAGKLTHENGMTLVDLNRAGSPLMEMVTEPDFRTPKEVSSFLKEVQRILRTLGTSDADMEKGMMRCDVNVSVRKKGAEKLGTKVEVKNMNSFRNIEKALEYEIDRQIELVEKGEKIVQETRGWDDAKEITLSQRNKEEAMDYRYFPEPDIPPLTFEEKYISKLKKEVPELPSQKMERYLSEYEISLNDGETLVNDLEVSNFFETVAKISGNPKKTANWMISEVLAVLNESGKSLAELPFSAEDLGKLIGMIESGKISGKIAKEIFVEMKEKGGDPEKIVTSKGMSQISDEKKLEKICQEVLAENPKLVEEYEGGKDKLFGSFIGQVMKRTGGKANPEMVNAVMKKLLQK